MACAVLLSNKLCILDTHGSTLLLFSSATYLASDFPRGGTQLLFGYGCLARRAEWGSRAILFFFCESMV